MRVRSLAVAAMLILAPAALRAQQPVAEPSGAQAAPPENLRDRLMPEATALSLTAPAKTDEQLNAASKEAAQPMMATRSEGTAYMLAGAALFIAGLIVEGDAGTVLVVAGAGIGAYGIYLHFR